jgi:RNA polymerase sigma factor (sigma-70 family)
MHHIGLVEFATAVFWRTAMSDDSSDPCGNPKIDPESTFALIERVRDGDAQALERLFARHLGPLQRWASGRLPKWARDLADTDDLVQDTLLKTFKRIESFEPRRVGALQAYLRNAVLNRLRDELRRKGREPGLTNLDDIELDAADSPLEAAIGREKVEAYERALEHLKPEEQEAIIARVELGYSYEELAVMLDKPSADAARKAAQRALVRLAEEMKRGRERSRP